MDVMKRLRSEVSAAKRKREDYLPMWQENVDKRRGKESDTERDAGRSQIPTDWTITKTKASQLFSQVPAIRLTGKHKQFDAAVPVYAEILNGMLKDAGVGAVMDECVVDCVNAAGIGAAIVRYEALTEPIQVPAVDLATLPPMVQMAALQGEFEIPMLDSTRITDRKFSVDRVSPSDLLWPATFRVSDWSKAPWLGHTDRCSWAEAKRRFGLEDEDKEKVVGAGSRRTDKQLNRDSDHVGHRTAEDLVEYDEVFYWRYLYHEDEKSYKAIQRVVFVAGMDEDAPAVDEPWTGQKVDEESGGYLGSCLMPIQILTLHYISDEAIPPSDSAIIRPQVEDLEESAQHTREQRKHSKPLRGFDVDKIDPSLQGDLIAGTWQGMIPTIGPGERAIWEVARSSYPRENLEFDRQLERRIQEATSVGSNQTGAYASGERSASEAQIVNASFQTEIGQQRAKVAGFFVGIAEVLAGLFALYGDVESMELGAALGPDATQRLGHWDRTRINQKFVFDVRADSTVRLDAQQLLGQLTSVLNVTAQSGFINPKPLIQKIVELNGLDPADVMVDPQAKGPEPPKVTYSFKGEDLLNPVALAIMVKAGQAPTPQELNAAKAMIEAAMSPGVSPAPAPQGPPPGPGAMGPGGPPPPPTQDPVVPEKAYPGYEASPRVITRRSEG